MTIWSSKLNYPESIDSIVRFGISFLPINILEFLGLFLPSIKYTTGKTKNNFFWLFDQNVATDVSNWMEGIVWLLRRGRILPTTSISLNYTITWKKTIMRHERRHKIKQIHGIFLQIFLIWYSIPIELFGPNYTTNLEN